ncbi:MAG: ABC transporter substrate-binding protein [Firmicutes bacterium]|nr:ABC transporter substrate-binding protein [Bacillota bacterium]
MKKKSILFICLVACLVFVLLLSGCAGNKAGSNNAGNNDSNSSSGEDNDSGDKKPLPEKDKIVIGGARSLSGPLAIQDQSCFGPVYRMWVDEVNARGGIYVKEYDKKLPVELKIYDDTSDPNTMINLLKKLMVEDKVDLLLAPISTGFLHAAAPIANDHGYLLIGAEGGAKELEPMMASLPYFFSLLNYATHQAQPFVDMIAEAGIKTAGVIFIADQHGVEYSGALVPLLEMAGIRVEFSRSIPLGVQDVSALIEEAKAKNVEALLCCAYPDENFKVMGQCMESDYNPKVIIFGPGICLEVFHDIFGPATEGVMGWGAWNEKSSPDMADLAKRLIEHQGGVRNVDWWGQAIYYSGLQIIEQAIERAGTLDNSVLKDVIATETFDTVMGKVWFENGGIPAECYPGQVGQWQDGIFEVVAPSEKATAKPLIPKPAWPAQ